MMSHFAPILLSLLLLGLPFQAFSASPKEELLSLDEVDISYEVFAASGDKLFLLLPVEFGHHHQNREQAKALSQAGIETWLVDIFSSHFLPISSHSMDRVPGEDIAAMIAHAHQRSGKQIYLLASGRGAIPALSGARLWHQQHSQADYFKGSLLLHPRMFDGIPEPGQSPRFVRIAHASSLPIYILQPTLTPTRWDMQQLVPVLGEGGSAVFVELIPGVRDYFYRSPDESDVVAKATERLPWRLQRAARLLAQLPPSDADVAPLPQTGEKKVIKEKGLEPYQGKGATPPLRLKDMTGDIRDLEDYRGKVVLVSLWASWCPPCVKEMPSMQRLQESLGEQQFAILAVNVAEERDTVARFLQRDVQVKFPVLLDPEGKATQEWKVFVFPSSYVVDKKGHIRYAVYGALEWDEPRIIAPLKALMAE